MMESEGRTVQLDFEWQRDVIKEDQVSRFETPPQFWTQVGSKMKELGLRRF